MVILSRLLLVFNAFLQETYKPPKSHSDVSPNLDEFKDNRETFESSDFESASAVSTVIADHWIPQPRSHSGYLAYVIFVGPNTGVFYNWSV